MAWKFGAAGAAGSLVLSEFLVFLGILRLMIKHNILKRYLLKEKPKGIEAPPRENAG